MGMSGIASPGGGGRTVTSEELISASKMSNGGNAHVGSVRGPAKQLEAHLIDPFTSRDLFGVVRGACQTPGCNACPGGYLKRTADYTIQPGEFVCDLQAGRRSSHGAWDRLTLACLTLAQNPKTNTSSLDELSPKPLNSSPILSPLRQKPYALSLNARNPEPNISNPKPDPYMIKYKETRGGRLGDEVTSQTQAIQSIADKTKVQYR